MAIAWGRLEERGARWANIVAALPGSYCGYVLWSQRHPGQTIPMNGAFIFCVVAFVSCICAGAILNYLRRAPLSAAAKRVDEVAALKEQLETLRREKIQSDDELWRAREFYRQCKEERDIAIKKLEPLRFLTPLQQETLQLANELAEFLKELGPPPAPKYTAEEIRNMNSAEYGRLLEQCDGDLIEAVEYHNGRGSLRLTEEGLYKQLVSHNLRMWPWYDKVEDGYTERFKSQVESIKRRFTWEGVQADDLLVPINGPKGAPNIRVVASKLWQLAFTLKEKELPNDKDPRLSQGN